MTMLKCREKIFIDFIVKSDDSFVKVVQELNKIVTHDALSSRTKQAYIICHVCGKT